MIAIKTTDDDILNFVKKLLKSYMIVVIFIKMFMKDVIAHLVNHSLLIYN